MSARIAVLASGRGSNLQALIDAIAARTLAAQIVGVFSDRLHAPALERVPAPLRWSRDAKAYAQRADFDAELGDAIDAVRPDWIVCAGFMRMLDEGFIGRFRGRVLNIHPSLLPAYRGLKTHARVLADGVAEHGASVHFVNPVLDGGAVIAQARIPVLPGDTADALAQRLLPAEHRLLVGVVQLAVAGRIAESVDTVLFDGHPLLAPLTLDSAGPDCMALPTR
jgi:phosphoribosylglycinamide formyltransferase-1